MNQGIGLSALRTSRDDCGTVARMVERSPVRDQLERLEKNLSTLNATIEAHRERLESCLARSPAPEKCPNGKDQPCGDCGLSERLMRFNESLEESTAILSGISAKVCL